MDKYEESICSRLSLTIVLLCIYGIDENESFYKSCQSLGRRNQNRLLREIIFFRSGIALQKIHKKIDTERRKIIFENFYDFIQKSLKIDDGFFIYDKINSYLNINLDKFTFDIIMKNSGFSINNLSEGDFLNLYNMYFPMQLSEFTLALDDIIEYILASPQKRKLMDIELNNLNLDNKSKKGCLSILIVILLLFSILI